MRRLALFALSLPSIAAAQVPGGLTYAGRLTDDGAPLEGPHDVEFRVFDVLEFGTPLWEELHEGVVLTGGVFSAVLGDGDVSPLDPSIFDGSELWLEIEVDGDVYEPRTALRSVPYAYRAGAAGDAETAFFAETAAWAGDADTVGGLAADFFATADHAHATDFAAFGACDDTDKVVGVDADTGAVECAPDVDTDTTYTFSTGLVTTDTTVEVDFSAVATAGHAHEAYVVSTPASTTGGSLTASASCGADTMIGATCDPQATFGCGMCPVSRFVSQGASDSAWSCTYGITHPCACGGTPCWCATATAHVFCLDTTP